MTLNTLRQNRLFIAYTLTPAVVTLFVITIGPFVLNVSNSLRDYYLVSAAKPKFIGFLNYYNIFFQDSTFWHSLSVTVVFVSVAVIMQFCLGLAIASLINQNRSQFARFVQGTLMLPLAATPIAMAFIWRLMYNPSLGVFNYFLHLLRLPSIQWLADPGLALVCLIIADTWQWTPFMMLILLAGLKALPIEPFEAARVDGASRWQSFVRITLPLLRPVAVIAILFRVIDSFKTFDIIFVITSGGPGEATESLNIYTFLKGLTYLRMGYASGLAVIMLTIVIFASQLLLKYSELEKERF